MLLIPNIIFNKIYMDMKKVTKEIIIYLIFPIACSLDIFVFLGDAQFDRGDFQHRNYVDTSVKNSTLLTIPIKHSGRFVTLIQSRICK